MHKYLKLFLFFSLFACRAQATESAACGSLVSASLVSLAGTASAVQSAAQEGIWADNESLKAAMKRGTYDFFESMGLKDFKQVYDQDVKKPNAPLDSAVTAFLNIAYSNTKTIKEKKEAFNKVVEQFTEAGGKLSSAAPARAPAPLYAPVVPNAPGTAAPVATKAPTSILPPSLTARLSADAAPTISSPQRELVSKGATANLYKGSGNTDEDAADGTFVNRALDAVAAGSDLLASEARAILPVQVDSNRPRWETYSDVKSYTDSEAVANLLAVGEHALTNDSYKYCYRSVKWLLCRPNHLRSHPYKRYAESTSGKSCEAASLLSGKRAPSSVPAKAGVSDLENLGFINLLKDPRFNKEANNRANKAIENPQVQNKIPLAEIRGPADAPKGSVLVYKKNFTRGKRCTSNTYGHIEIKADDLVNGGYLSDFKNTVPISQQLYKLEGDCYTLIGVMIKPGG